MKIIGINKAKCTGCLACVKDCSPRLFSMQTGSNKAIIFADPYENCIACGHCVSVCPVNAIIYESEGEPVSFPGINDLSHVIPSHTMLSFLKGKRSIRQYRKRSVSREEIESVLSAMQYAPSERNAGPLQYIVMTDPTSRQQLTDGVMEVMKKTKLLFRFKRLASPFLSGDLRILLKKPGAEKRLLKYFDDYDHGIDRIFFHAPCIIICHSHSSSRLTGNSAGIALTYGMLAAQSLGLGTCWIGIAQEAFSLEKALKKQTGIPDKHRVHGVIIMGYPDVTYYRTPVRKPLTVRMIDK
ncbi:MAG: nitroreductase family protein [Spirochaetales bacterium]|nr:nitroreductase family protein [Spirochaetales bacterium]